MKPLASGQLSKMAAHLESPVSYQLKVNDAEIPLNERLGSTIRLAFSGQIFCTHCGRKTNKSFNQGYCYPCFRKLAQCDTCIMSPEKCHFAGGTCREPEWGQSYCMVPHIVYLANASGVKVGITRKTQVPTRWIDQGASQALAVFEVTSRRLSGLVEATLRQQVSDRTNWRAMLKGPPPARNLFEDRDALLQALGEEVAAQLKLEETLIETEHGQAAELTALSEDAIDLEYPVLEYPQKVVSLNPEKTPVIEGTLLGIKGQYLILDTGCINVRKFTAYEIEFAA